MTPLKRNSALSKIFPFLKWAHKVNSHTLKDDIIAGLTGAIVVLPQGVAFAAIAGMPPEYGLYAGMVPAIIAALFGSSWHLVSGPTTAASIVLFSALSEMAQPGSMDYVRLALTLTFMVGVIQLVMGLVKLGALVNFISHSVVIGFTAGAAVLIASNQVKNFFGIEMERGLHFYEVIGQLISNFSHINIYITAIATTTLVVGLLAKRFAKKVPYMIVAMLAGSLLSIVLDMFFGNAVTNIDTVGAIPASLPPLSSPDFDFQTIKDLVPIAFAATLFALTEAVSIARSIAAKSGQHIDGNQEFVGQGLSNIAGSFFSGYVATGSFNRSGLNYEAGAKTPVAALAAGGFLIAIVLLVAPYASYLPNATMAAILFMVAWGIIDFEHIKKIFKTSKSETSILVTTFFATLFLALDFAIFLGVMLSLVMYLNRTSKPKIFVRVPDERLPNRKFNTDSALPECPQLKLVRIDGSLFFGAVNHVQDTLLRFEDEKPEQKNLLLLAQGINFVDSAGAELIEKKAKHHKAIGGKLFIYGAKEAVSEQLRRGGYIDVIGSGNIFSSKTEALSVIYNQHLDKDICATCDKRIFNECKVK
ncbi:MAG: SulP family inorganic anion transporter [Gammaproteobacteria bacterium]|nr:SulP family inorganic anion transporter [Gammaproteobacteria bacterium]